jgi:hypothetical protein
MAPLPPRIESDLGPPINVHSVHRAVLAPTRLSYIDPAREPKEASRDDMLEHWRAQVAQMKDDLAFDKMFGTRFFEFRGGERVDVTDDWTDQETRRISFLERLIAAITRRDT